jgi:hypothetical protein
VIIRRLIEALLSNPAFIDAILALLLNRLANDTKTREMLMTALMQEDQ